MHEAIVIGLVEGECGTQHHRLPPDANSAKNAAAGSPLNEEIPPAVLAAVAPQNVASVAASAVFVMLRQGIGGLMGRRRDLIAGRLGPGWSAPF